MISLYKNDSQLGTELSFKFREAIAENGKAFSNGEFVKHCLMIFAERACPDKKYLFEQTCLSRFTVARRIDALSDHLEDALAERIRKFSHYSLAIDESVDISDPAQLVVSVQGVTEDFEVDEELLDMASMESTTTGENIAQEVLKIVQKFRLDPKKMSGLTTDGAPAMVRKHNGFTKKFLEAFEAQSVVVNHCIIHLANLCNKAPNAINITKEVVRCINYIRFQGLSHRQIKFFLEELECLYPDIAYFSSVC